jgi:hypothetical protein
MIKEILEKCSLLGNEISKVEKKCRIPEGMLIPGTMTIAAVPIMMISFALPDGPFKIAPVYAGYAIGTFGIMGLICMGIRDDRLQAARQRRLLEPEVSDEKTEDPAPSPPALAIDDALVIPVSVSVNLEEGGTELVPLNSQGDKNEKGIRNTA